MLKNLFLCFGKSFFTLYAFLLQNILVMLLISSPYFMQKHELGPRPHCLERISYLKTVFSLWTLIKCFPSKLPQRNLTTQQSSVILDLWLRRPRSGKLSRFHFKMFIDHTKTKIAFWNSQSLNSVFKQDRFRDGSVWTVGLTVGIKLRFQISQAQCESCLIWTSHDIYLDCFTFSVMFMWIHIEAEPLVASWFNLLLRGMFLCE